MTTEQPERIPIRTDEPAVKLLARFQDFFPGVMNDGVLDVQRLAEVLGVRTAGVPQEKERYGLMWAGRKGAVTALQQPSLAALVPDMENSINWDTAKNVFIEGDNLEVLKLLQKAYNDQVDLIYIDPPYNTGNDFVYNDDFSDTVQRYLEVSGQVDGEGNRLVANTDVSGRKHSKWISMMYPRLMLARNLLRETGVCAISIDDSEIAALSWLCDEVFGESNRLARLIWNRGNGQQQGTFKVYHEYVLVYARNVDKIEGFVDRSGGEIEHGALKKVSQANPLSDFTFPAGVRCDAEDETEFSGTWGGNEPTSLIAGTFRVRGGRTLDEMTLSAAWPQKNQMRQFFAGEEVLDSRGQKVLEFYFSKQGKLFYRKERSRLTPPTIQDWGAQSSATAALKSFLGVQAFDWPKPIKLVQDLVAWMVPEDGLVVDFFAGSGTTAHATALQNAEDGGNRRYLLINAPEETSEKSNARAAGFVSIPEITRLRLKKVTESMPAAGDMGLRCLTLGPSSFVDTRPGDNGGLPLLVENTLRSEATDDAIAAEVLLKSGVRLDERWNRTTLDGEPVVESGSVAVVLARRATDNVCKAALEDKNSHTTVFLEDSFAEADGVKTNAYFAYKQANKTMKTI